MLLPILAFLLAIPLTAADEPRGPATPERKALTVLQDAMSTDDLKAVQRAYEQIAKEFAGKEAVDEAAWYCACFHYGKGRLDQSQDLLLSLRRSGRRNRWTSLALIALADLAREHRDERAMLGYLEEAVKAPPTATGRNLMDTLDTRQDAFIRLASYYRDKRDFRRALDYYSRWEPASWCGNDLVALRQQRDHEIILCRLQLGGHATVARDTFLDLQKYDEVSNFRAWVLWNLYRDAGQLDDLRGMLDNYEKGRKERPRDEELPRSPTHVLRGLLRVQSLAEKKDVQALVRLCHEEIWFDGMRASDHAETLPIHSMAAEALATLGGVAAEAIKSALGKKPKVSGWLIYALGRSSAPSSLEVLQRAAEDTERGDGCRAQNIAYALALKGRRGKEILKRLAGQESAMGAGAKEWLERTAQPAWPAPTWPRAKAGSLPKALPGPR
jgi:hypothetical protein